MGSRKKIKLLDNPGEEFDENYGLGFAKVGVYFLGLIFISVVLSVACIYFKYFN